jgi:hypothetical protein
MTDIKAFLDQRVPANRILDRPAMAALAKEIGGMPELWRDQVKYVENERHFAQLYREPGFDVWMICWHSAQDTGYHDHDQSSGAVYVVEGVLCEDSFCKNEDGWIRERTREHTAGNGFDFPAAYIHGVRHPGGEPAVSIHVYSPALWRMGHYEYDADGTMGRVSMTYADELAESA